MSHRLLLGLGSVAFHGALAFAVGSVPTAPVRETVSISIVEQKAPEPPPPPPPPPSTPSDDAPRAPARPAAAPKVAADAKAPQAAARGADVVPDFGLSPFGGDGPGLAIPQGPGGGAAPQRPDAAGPPVKKALAQARPADEGCAEPDVKAKPLSVPQPAYTTRAREANVAGKVRVEISIDASGKVTSARVLSGLGHGLDEAALDAARRASFSPATRCGKPVAGTFVVGMKFSL